GRRQLQAEREQLHQEQASLQERAGALDRLQATLNQRESDLTQETRHWQAVRLRLQEEVRGLENRVANARRKLLEQQQEFNRPQEIVHQVPSGQAHPVAIVPTPPPPEPTEAEFRSRLAMLQQLAGEVADQRLCLAEQYELLAQARQQWEQKRASLAAELEALAERLRQ